MLAVLVTLTLSCGCTEALVGECSAEVIWGEWEGSYLAACSADVCRGKWWCECVSPEDPHVCEHVETLLMMLEAAP